MISLSCSDDSNEKTVLHITEETDDDLLASTPTTHTTEDLFTIIHRFDDYIMIFTDSNITADAFPQKVVGKVK